MGGNPSPAAACLAGASTLLRRRVRTADGEIRCERGVDDRGGRSHHGFPTIGAGGANSSNSGYGYPPALHLRDSADTGFFFGARYLLLAQRDRQGLEVPPNRAARQPPPRTRPLSDG